MTPATTVSNVTNHARLNGERLVAPVVVSEYPMNRPDNEAPVMPRAPQSPNNPALLNDANVKQLRDQNTKSLLKSNYWFEMANIARWCTTGLIGATMVTIFSVAGFGSIAALKTATFATIAPAIGGALISAPVLALFGVLAVAATITVKASQHSRKVFVEKSFDVQDTLMQRQAQLVGKSVEEAVAPQQAEPARASWAARAQASLEAAESQQAAR